MGNLYKSLTWRVRIAIIIGLITILSTSLVWVATASVGTGPVLENFTPANGTTLTVTNPKISFTASTPTRLMGLLSR